MLYFCFKVWQLCYVFCQFSQIAVYDWNKKWKNGKMPCCLPAMNTWRESHSCILNLVYKSWLECSLKCILAVMFTYSKHYWRPENENAQSLNRRACIQKEHLAGFTDNSEDSELSSSLSRAEKTCWTFLLSQFQIFSTFTCSISIFKLFKLKASVASITLSGNWWQKKEMVIINISFSVVVKITCLS